MDKRNLEEEIKIGFENLKRLLKDAKELLNKITNWRTFLNEATGSSGLLLQC